ncbi:subtilisin-like protease SBT1.5 [Amborella trichopoda]|nr:subtilisin-like protease SBT1.5 [Amborella trichopoda]|eukprot:XP_006841510.2 subtilisin-like protease SBT1.5 [Amborella trichopoda]
MGVMENWIWVFVIFALWTCACSSSEQERARTFIVRVQHDLKPTVFPTHEHWYKSMASSSPTAQNLIHLYHTVFNGFSAKLTPSQASQLSNHPAVLSLFEDRPRKLHTTRSPQFLGLSQEPNTILPKSDYGSNLIIGVLDTGVWPERRSFSDTGVGPIPSRWKGECQDTYDFPKTLCNRKLIGARFFSGGYEAAAGAMNETLERKSPRDTDGHGTHTASTAAGNMVPRASALGYARGVASGMAPLARLAVYKVCWATGCFDSDILAAMDSAVNDGVDVLSMSLGGGAVPYYMDAMAVGSFGAVEQGVFVAASAGNEGPGEMTVTNVAPWITTVGAGTIDRGFPADVVLGDGRVISGVSIYRHKDTGRGHATVSSPAPLIYAGTAGHPGGFGPALCMENSLDPSSVQGKIVICERGSSPRASKGVEVKRAGGAGMILANSIADGEGLIADSHVLPAVGIGARAGDLLLQYTNQSSSPPQAKFIFRGTALGVHPAPIVATFSSRGPNPESHTILKPDLLAPGVNILAAWIDGLGPSGMPSDKRKAEFNVLSGTSMACPHVAGLALLLKGAHPEWSAAMVRSALMTTAYTRDNIGGTLHDEANGNLSTPLASGAGHVDPQKALDPGLVYDINTEDYIAFLCNSNYSETSIRTITKREVHCGTKGWVGDLNYPAFTVVFEGERVAEMRRVVKNVGDNEVATYRVGVIEPKGVRVSVVPQELVFRRKGEELSYRVRVEKVGAEAVAEAEEMIHFPGPESKVSHGTVTWTDGKHVVRSPVTVVTFLNSV